MKLPLTAAALVLASGVAFAQGANTSTTATSPAAPMAAPATTTGQAGAQTPAATVNTTAQTASPSPSSVQTRNTTHRTAAAPVAGRNSFTMSQATRRISSAGYTKVMGLKKDNQGIWRGQAEKDGSPVAVSLDYQGNVTGQ
jgi:hypothetical protein